MIFLENWGKPCKKQSSAKGVLKGVCENWRTRPAHPRLARVQAREVMGKLTVKGVAAIKEPGIYGDGDGLFLRVGPTGARRWVLRTKIKGHRIEMGLGSVSLVPLAQARQQAARWRGVARRGGDPRLERNQSHGSMIFEEAARQVWQDRIKGSGQNGKHKAQWITTLETYAFPMIGQRRVDEITSAQVLKVLSPIWLSKPETARRVRQRMAVVFDWCIVAGHREKASPLVGVEAGLPRQSRSVAHHKSLPWVDVPEFMAALRGAQGWARRRWRCWFLPLHAPARSEA